MPDQENENSTLHTVERMMLHPSVAQLYANQFAFGVSTADVAIVLRTNGRPHTQLNLSHISAKSLAQELLSLLEDFEKSANFRIPTVAELAQATNTDEA